MKSIFVVEIIYTGAVTSNEYSVSRIVCCDISHIKNVCRDFYLEYRSKKGISSVRVNAYNVDLNNPVVCDFRF